MELQFSQMIVIHSGVVLGFSDMGPTSRLALGVKELKLVSNRDNHVFRNEETLDLCINTLKLSKVTNRDDDDDNERKLENLMYLPIHT